MSSNFSIYFTIFVLIFQWKRQFFLSRAFCGHFIQNTAFHSRSPPSYRRVYPPPGVGATAPSTLPQARRSSPCRMPAVLSRHLPEQRRIVRPKSPAKNFFGGAIKRPRPALYKRTATQAPLKIAEKQLDGGQRHDEENNG